MDFVTDRTEADVLLGNAKGLYQAADLNRVEQDVAELASLAVQLDMHLTLATKTDWAAPGAFSPTAWPTRAQMERYLGNVWALLDAFGLPGAAVPAHMDRLTFEGANAIEDALLRVHTRARSVINAYRYSGELIAGEETGL